MKLKKLNRQIKYIFKICSRICKRNFWVGDVYVQKKKQPLTALVVPIPFDVTEKDIKNLIRAIFPDIEKFISETGGSTSRILKDKKNNNLVFRYATNDEEMEVLKQSGNSYLDNIC